MNASIAEGSLPLARVRRRPTARLLPGPALVMAALVCFALTRPAWQVAYNHFVWQADAFLHGRATIDYPVLAPPAAIGNSYFNDVEEVLDATGTPTGQAQIPFPPLPALVLLPLVALWGLATDQVLVSVFLGALDVAIAYWMLGQMAIRPGTRRWLTLFVAAGSALWYAASLGTTWYFAHVVAVGFALAGVGMALGADARWNSPPIRPAPRSLFGLDGRQVLAGVLIGLAATSRLTVAFGALFLIFAGGGRDGLRRAVAAGIGVAIPVGALLVYTLLTTGSLFNPVYQHLYEYEVLAYPDLGYNATFAISDPRYIPQNLGIMLFGLPNLMPACPDGVARTLFSQQGCSWLVPRPTGLSVVLAYPGLLLGLAAIPLRGDPRLRRILAGAVAAAGLVAVVNLMHFSQGWVQFGYRFSLDFLPFLLVPVAYGADWLAGRVRAQARALVPIAVIGSIAVQAWGIAWARTIGW